MGEAFWERPWRCEGRRCLAWGQGSRRHIWGMPGVSVWQEHKGITGTREKGGKAGVGLGCLNE